MSRNLPQPDWLQLAKQGDAQAIAKLVERSLPASSVQVYATLQHDCLHLLLEASPLPTQQALSLQVHKILLDLDSPLIHQVHLRAKQRYTSACLWSERFRVDERSEAPSDQPPPLPSPSANLSDPPLSSPQLSKPQHNSAQPIADSALHRSQPPQPPVAHSRNVSDPVHPTERSRSRSQQDLGYWVLEHFNLWQVGFVVLLGIHIIFESHHYTVSGFLNHQDWLMMFLHNVNLIFHEAGHTLLILFGQFIYILGGSLVQIAIPAILSGYFWFTRQRYASAIALWWMGQNFMDVSIYIKDAQARALPLLGGENVIHDWHFLLVQMNLLPQTQLIGNLSLILGIAIALSSVVLGLVWSRRSQRPRDIAN